MKVIGHKAPGYGGTYFFEKPSVEGKKNQVIFPIVENGLPVISLVVYVVNAVWTKIHRCVFNDSAFRRSNDRGAETNFFLCER